MRKRAARDEAVRRYEDAARRLSPEQYERAAGEAFAELSPDERRDVGRRVRDGGREHGAGPRWAPDDDRLAEDPEELAHLAAHVHGQQPALVPRVVSPNRTGTDALGRIADRADRRRTEG